MMKKFMQFTLVLSILFSFLTVQAFAASPVVWDSSSVKNSDDFTIENDGLMITINPSGASNYIRASEGKIGGKWYWEFTLETEGVGYIGILQDVPPSEYSTSMPGAFRLDTSKKGDVIGVAFDADDLILTYYVNGEQRYQFTTGLEQYEGKFYPCLACSSFVFGGVLVTNFGATPFVYDVPEGYLPYSNVTGGGSEDYPSLTVLMEVGETIKFAVTDPNLLPTDFIWSSSDVAVATVDGNGNVTAVAIGTTRIWAETGDGTFRDYIPVKVIDGTGEPEPSERRMVVDLTAGDSAKLHMTDDATAVITWTSMDTGVAAVDSQGKVTAVAPGMALITAQYNGSTQVIYIRVNA